MIILCLQTYLSLRVMSSSTAQGNREMGRTSDVSLSSSAESLSRVVCSSYRSVWPSWYFYCNLSVFQRLVVELLMHVRE